MIILGLAGPAGCGKDTVADYLVTRYGYEKFAFSDRLYAEVTAAFDLESEDLLRDRATKDALTTRMAAENCSDSEFLDLLCSSNLVYSGSEPLSPRQVLQWWGTEFRRASDPDYWVKKTAEWLAAVPQLFAYPEQVPTHFVNTTVRFPNERQWIHDMGGNVWHIRRRDAKPVVAHISETPLEIWPGERELHNNDSIERLHYGIDLLMTTSARFVAVEPMLKESDANCITLPNGECVGGKMTGMEPCMHDPKELK